LVPISSLFSFPGMISVVLLLALQSSPPEAHLPPAADRQAVADLEQDLVSLHARLRASLVTVHLPLRGPSTEQAPEGLAKAELITSGTVLDNYGLVVVPLDLPPGFPKEAISDFVVYRADGKAFPATLLATNNAYGLSLLRAEGLEGLAPPFGVGTWHEEGSLVYSLGNAFGLPASLQTGVLSGRRRSIGQAQELLQITNPINQGDAGGILADRHGDVIGILLTSLASAATRIGPSELAGMPAAERQEWLNARKAQGVSFAVPVELMPLLFPRFLPHMSQMRQLGVLVEVQLCVTKEEGSEPGHCWQVLVTGLADSGPAIEAGIKPGDILLRLGGMPTTSLQELGRAIMSAPVRTSVEILRDAQQLSLPIRFPEAKKKVGEGHPDQDPEHEG